MSEILCFGFKLMLDNLSFTTWYCTALWCTLNVYVQLPSVNIKYILGPISFSSENDIKGPVICNRMQCTLHWHSCPSKLIGLGPKLTVQM